MKIFISSTIKDLLTERSLIQEETLRLGFTPFCSEFEGARWQSVSKTIEQEIIDCQIFVGIYGERYGYVPPPSVTEDIYNGNISVTEAEFKQAGNHNKPLLIYIKKTSKREEPQKFFLSEVEDFYQGSYINYFNNPDELKSKFKSDIVLLITSLLKGDYRYPKHKMPGLAVFSKSKELYEYVAREMIGIFQYKSLPTIGLFAGRTASAVYDKFVNLLPSYLNEIKNLLKARFFMNAEHFGLADEHPNTYRNFLISNFLQHIESITHLSVCNNLIVLPGNIKRGRLDNIFLDYDSKIGGSRIHLQLLGIAPNGQVASIDPVDSAECSIECLEKSYTNIVRLSEFSSSYLFPKPITEFDITMGFGNILQCADRILLIASGKKKAEILKRTLLSPISTNNPASILRRHNDLTIACDSEAVSKIPESWLKKYPNLIKNTMVSRCV